jgi:hypothetical protein
MKLPAVLSLVLLTAACAKPLEVGSITEIKPRTAGAQGLDVYAKRRAAGEALPAMAGDQVVEVRTYSAGTPDKAREEMAGAACSLSTGDFVADFTTPAKVRVPNYRDKSSVLAVSCDKPGYQRKLEEVAVYNATKANNLAAGSGAGVVGLVVALAVNEMGDTSAHTFIYPPIILDMEAVEQKHASAAR